MTEHSSTSNQVNPWESDVLVSGFQCRSCDNLALLGSSYCEDHDMSSALIRELRAGIIPQESAE